MPQIVPLESSAPVTETPHITPPSHKSNEGALPLTQAKGTEIHEGPKEEISEVKKEYTQNQERIASLIRKEKQLLRRARDLSEKERQINETQSKYKPWQEAAELAKQNKLEAIKKLDITYDDLTQQILNNGNVPPERIAQLSAAEAAKREIEQFKKDFYTQQQRQSDQYYQNAMRMMDAEVQWVAGKSEKYPLVKLGESYQDVSRFIQDEFHRTGRIIPVEEALDRWEADLKTGFDEIARIRNPSPEKVAEVARAQENEPAHKPTTLTNKLAQGTPGANPETETERKRRAIEAFYGRTNT